MSLTSSSWLAPASGAAAARYPDVDWGHVAAATLLCIGLGIAAILMLRKRLLHGAMSRAAPASRMRIVEQTRLAPRTTLHLVEYDRRIVMLVTDATGVKVLDAHDLDPDC
ncbi:flagellar biosynthetic protein FliO [Burkholderia sp. BCC1977]|uniref:flagellar biosynthetic protein FliO n=1 Tax=Burkholderia sp. BCC1977 TaxID=2817440 RepID=UPI002ABDF7F6|nr:flagellar biosynthetic protein FliO [Burkholderia sp. BCC1977]